MEKKTKPRKSVKARAVKEKQGDLVFALDIGTRYVVGVLAQKTPAGCRIIDMETAAHSCRSMSDGQIEDIRAVTADVKRVRRELENRNHVALTSACVAAAGRTLKTLRSECEYKFSPHSAITEEQLRESELDAVRRTCDAFAADNAGGAGYYCVGHSVIERRLDGFKTAKPEGHRGESLTTQLVAAFLPVNVVESLCAVVEGANMEVSGLTLEPIAAMNAVVPPDIRVINLALCDIGAGTSDVAVSKDGSVIAYGMATVAGDEITEAIMKELLVDFSTAERIKISPEKEVAYKNILALDGKVTRERIEEIIAPAVRHLAKTITSEILKANGETPQAVFLVGGSSKLRALPQFLSEELGLDISRIIVGNRDTLRGIIAPNDMELGGEHSTPLGIAISAGEGVQYDFTTITINGRKYRAPDTGRLTVFELLPFAKIKPEQLIAGAGKPLSFTLSGEKKLLRGEPPKPSEIMVNGKAANLGTVVKKGDEINVEIAKKGEDAKAKLSDFFDMSLVKSVTVTLLGKKHRAGRYLLLNGREITADRRIHEGDEVSLVEIHTLGELLAALSVADTGDFLVNDEPKSLDYKLHSGDVITRAVHREEELNEASVIGNIDAYEKQAQTAEPNKADNGGENSGNSQIPDNSENIKNIEPVKPVENNEVPEATRPARAVKNPIITINGVVTEFPYHEDGTPPIFLDVAAAFSDNPTELLNLASVITLNGKMARLDEVINDGDVIVIE